LNQKSKSTKQESRGIDPSIAVALKHEMGQGQAPVVVASGAGLLARRIVQLAEEAGVPIQKDDHLAQLLSAVEVNQEIPEELYEAVARILAFIYRIDAKGS